MVAAASGERLSSGHAGCCRTSVAAAAEAEAAIATDASWPLCTPAASVEAVALKCKQGRRRAQLGWWRLNLLQAASRPILHCLAWVSL